jgi:hypothetical protein
MNGFRLTYFGSTFSTFFLPATLDLLAEVRQVLVGRYEHELLVGSLADAVEEAQGRPDALVPISNCLTAERHVRQVDEVAAVLPELGVDLILVGVPEHGRPPLEGEVVLQEGAGVADDHVGRRVALVEAVLAEVSIDCQSSWRSPRRRTPRRRA